MNSFFQEVAYIPSFVQLIIICFLFVAIVLIQHRVFLKTGRFSHNYPVFTFTLCAPIYEEVIFRGFLLSGFLSLYGQVWAIIITSVLFGLWHIRSIFFFSYKKTFFQILYTGLILGPIFSIITIFTGSIWNAVILHFVVNIFAPILESNNRKAN